MANQDVGQKHQDEITKLTPAQVAQNDQDEAAERDDYNDQAQEILEKEMGGGKKGTDADASEKTAIAESFYTGGPETKSKKLGLVGKAKNKKMLLLGGAGGGLALIAVVVVLMIFFSNFKVVHFSEILNATGYARLHTIMRDRASTNLIEGAYGEGTNAVESTLMQKLKAYNPNTDLTVLGTDNRMSFIRDTDGNIKGVNIDGTITDLDTITSENFNGKTFKEAGPREKMTARKIFSDNVSASVSENLALDGRTVQGSTTKLVYENIGFKWSRWRDAARDFIGKDPLKANAEALTTSLENVVGDDAKLNTGVDSIDNTANDAVDPAKIDAYLEKVGRVDDQVYRKVLMESAANHQSTAANIAKVSEKVSAGVIVMSLACMTNLATSRLEDIKKENVVHAQREGLQMTSAGSQVKYGDTTAEANSAESRLLDGADLSPGYQYDIGNTNAAPPDNFVQPQLAPNISDTLVKFVDLVTSPSTWIDPTKGGLTGLPGFSNLSDAFDQKFCETLLSPGGMAAATVAEISAQAIAAALSGGGFTVASEEGAMGIARLIVSELGSATWSTATGLFSKESIGALVGISLYGVGLEAVTMMLAGQSFNGLETGPERYENARVGTSLVQDQQMRSMLYGRPLSKDEASGANSSAQKQVRGDWDNKGTFAKYFSLNNPWSVTSSYVATMPSTPQGLVSSLQNFTQKLGTVFLPSSWLQPASVFAHHAAAADYDPTYGTTQWGYSPAEIDKLANNPSFNLNNNANYVEARMSALDGKYAKCFDADQDQYTANKLATGDCSAESLSSDDALHYRVYKGLDAATVDILTQDIAHPKADTLTDDGGGGAINTDIVVGDTSGETCNAGTDGGVGDGYAGGKLYKIRLCIVAGMDVNSQVATNVDQMVKDAGSQGLKLTGGGFRTMEEQIALRRAHGCGDIYNASANSCSPPTARPGYSNHQMGLAVDLNCNGSLIRSHSSPCFVWLAQHAGQYGFKNLPSEAWHWSIDGH